jgi:hypothetical protein
VSAKIDWYADDVKRSVAERALREIERAIQSVSCPEHGGHANTCRVDTDQGSSPHRVVHVEPCCCEKLKSAAGQARNEALKRLRA